MVFLRAVAFCFLCSRATCRRLNGESDKIQVDSEGIDDYDMAPEYMDVWTNNATLTSLESDAMGEMNEMNLGISDMTALDKEKLIRKSWLLEAQRKVNTEGCPSLVMWCQPSRNQFDGEGGFESILITREKGWGDKFKVLSNSTNCGRVGFEVFQGGKLVSYHKNVAITTLYGLKSLREITEEEADEYDNEEDYENLEHCEWLRRRPFDMRHAVECVKHSQLCEMGEATAVPYGSQNAKDVSIAISKHGPTSLTFGEDSTPAVKIFADALEEKEREKLNGKATWETCIKLLCEYKGFKKAGLKLHPDRFLRMELTEKEKEEKTKEFKYLVNCKDSLKGPDGKELTLNQKEHRDSLCYK